MKTLRNLAIVSVLGASAVFAQNATTSGNGLLGNRYVAASFGVLDIKHSDRDNFGFGAVVNLPVASNIDVGLFAGYDWTEGAGGDHSTQGGGYVTYHIQEGAFRPYVSAEIGHASLSYGRLDHEDTTYYGAEVGTEYQINDKLFVDVSVGYGDAFENGDHSAWSTSATLSYWLQGDLCVGVSVSYIEHGEIAYGVGAAWKF